MLVSEYEKLNKKTTPHKSIRISDTHKVFRKEEISEDSYHLHLLTLLYKSIIKGAKKAEVLFRKVDSVTFAVTFKTDVIIEGVQYFATWFEGSIDESYKNKFTKTYLINYGTERRVYPVDNKATYTDKTSMTVGFSVHDMYPPPRYKDFTCIHEGFKNLCAKFQGVIKFLSVEDFELKFVVKDLYNDELVEVLGSTENKIIRSIDEGSIKVKTYVLDAPKTFVNSCEHLQAYFLYWNKDREVVYPVRPHIIPTKVCGELLIGIKKYEKQNSTDRKLFLHLFE